MTFRNNLDAGAVYATTLRFVSTTLNTCDMLKFGYWDKTDIVVSMLEKFALNAPESFQIRAISTLKEMNTIVPKERIATILKKAEPSDPSKERQSYFVDTLTPL